MIPIEVQAAHVALDAARAVFRRADTAEDTALLTPAARAQALWDGAASVLRVLTRRDDLHDRALIREASNRQLLSLEDAHALVAMCGWREQSADGPALAPATPSAAERSLASSALRALTHAVERAQGVAEDDRLTARLPGTARHSSSDAAAPALAPAVPPPAIPPAAVGARTAALLTRRRPAILLAVVLSIVAVGGVATWYGLESRRRPTALDDGVAAYARGSRETARIAFARAAREHPRDITPLIFLGRIAREDGNLTVSRRFLDAAIRLAPTNALANRELASSVLASGDAEVARRFYVRALQADPSDRLSQGFLGCALFRLGRSEEARRWANRAGPGDWMPCLAAAGPIPSAR